MYTYSNIIIINYLGYKVKHLEELTGNHAIVVIADHDTGDVLQSGTLKGQAFLSARNDLVVSFAAHVQGE